MNHSDKLGRLVLTWAVILWTSLLLTACGGGAGADGQQGDALKPSVLAASPTATVALVSSSISKSSLSPGQVQSVLATIQSGADQQGLYAELRIVDSQRQTIARQTFDPLALSAGVPKQLQFDYQVPANLPLGRYSAEVGVWNGTTWETYVYESISFFDVAAAQTTQVAVVDSSASPTPLSAGQLLTAKVTLRSLSDMQNLHAQIRVVDSQGTRVGLKSFDNLALTGGSPLPIQFDYQSPTTLPAGRYTIQTGVWSPNWDTTYVYEITSTLDVVASGGNLPAPVLVTQRNLLSNPGFEDGTTSWNYHWGNAVVGTSNPRTGSRAYEVSPNGGFSTQYLMGRLAKGQGYRLNFYAMLGNGSGGTGHMNIRITNGQNVDSNQGVDITSTSYQLYSVDFNVPADTQDVVVDFQKWGAASTLYVDDVEIVSTTQEPPLLYAQPSATPAGGIGYPFGSHKIPYVAGIKPTSQTQAAQDSAVMSFYDQWKPHALATSCGNYFVKFDGHPEFATVSEGIGYGMLMTVVMAGHDADAKAEFDGLFRFARAHPAYEQDSALMDWRVNADCTSGGAGWGAGDGDLDIAMGLLLADKQWGSAGAINYMAEAVKSINAIKMVYFNRDAQLPNTSRTSDYMTGHFRAFKKATGDVFWDRAISQALGLLEFSQANYAPGTGLIPDFLVGVPDNPRPAPPYGGGDRSATDGDFAFNGCRTPWRLAADYVLSGDARVKAVNMKVMNFLQSASGGSADQVSIYKLDGTRLVSYAAYEFFGPATAGAMMDASQQGFLNNLWDKSSTRPLSTYYENELLFLGMVVASGNWWTP